ncbi:hypothetical protein [Streptomyces sp. NPDC020298]|uniref:hypothetical protein n=1 Tax=unclassified Streptomyces TaxID=2593676 RepID=UPI0033C2D344
MTEPLTQQQLDEIAARAQAATPGPWEEHAAYGPDFYANVSGPYLRGVGTLNFGDGEDAEADREFVKHAREDVAALLAEVHRLRAQVAAVTALCDAAEKQATRWEHPLPVPEWVTAVRQAIQEPAEESHVVADDSDDPEHIDDCPGCETETGTGQCGARHHRYPETVCTEPASHYRRDVDSHAGTLILDGRQAGAAVWDEPAPLPSV